MEYQLSLNIVMDTNVKDTRKGRASISLQGGLGNQLFQLCAGLQLMYSSNRNVFFFEQFLFNFGSKRRSLAIRELLHGLNCSRYFYLISFPLIMFGTKSKMRFVLNVPSDIDPSKMNSNFLFLNGWFQSYKLVSEVHRFLIERFENSASFAPLVHVERINAVGVHLRFGDFESSSKTRKYHGLTATSHFDDAIAYLTSNLTQIDKIIFVTDDLDRAKSTINELLSCRDSIPIEVISSKPIEDMATLSSCSGIVLSNSSFSWWAGYLGSTLRASSVVAPRPWLAFESEFDQSLVAPRWHFINRDILKVGGCNSCIH